MGNSAPSSPDPTKPSLKSIANVAAAGMATANISSIVDELLDFPTLPHLPRLPSDENIPQVIRSIFEESNVQFMVLLDLLCCSARNWDVCNHLIDAIRTHTSATLLKNLQTNPVANTQDTKAAGLKQRVNRLKRLSDFFQHVQSLNQLGAPAEFPLQEQALFTKMFHKSLQYFFCQAVFSLLPDQCKQYASFCRTMSRQVHSVQEAFSQQRSKSKEVLTDSLQKHGDHFQSRTDSKQEKPNIHHSMKQLVHLLEKEVPLGGITSMVTRYDRFSLILCISSCYPNFY